MSEVIPNQGDGLYGPVQTRIPVIPIAELEDLEAELCVHPEESTDIHVHIEHRGRVMTTTTSRSCGRCGVMLGSMELRRRVHFPEGAAAWGELVASIMGPAAWSRFSVMVAQMRRQVWIPRSLVDRYEVTEVNGLPELRVKRGQP